LFADPGSEDAALREAAHLSEQRSLTALRDYQDSIVGSPNGEHSEH
jgi:quinol---cytochrome-c reductase cytochrome b subunit